MADGRTQTSQAHVAVRDALAAGDLVRAAYLEATAADRDGYDVTAQLLRDLAAEIERLRRGK